MAYRAQTIVTLLFIPVLIATCFFFGVKFYEFVRVALYESDGVFAVTPIVNYLLAGMGFLCMLGWATYNGMFRDIERPKITMLENEERLDAAERAKQSDSNRDSKGKL
jgi:hypothetical protein